ncbi:WXG100-like domain-containing protein [Williamsia sterculiae]|uniref:Outer membrane channel protein CpnT-like N-terminal domain-containing protein n=1 Tax=Williamsia sterculiae TaxID=1344003 RepID=A0A1N7GVC6_9NOCA|nr:hypothetical protein [Williamsia sterculiae]SIS16551.1 hypothetical protein SAMN05445060_3131 [Williamsia sterculiae]
MISPPSDVADAVARLAGDRWPSVDEDALRGFAARYRSMADRLVEVALRSHEADGTGVVGRAGAAHEQVYRQLIAEDGPMATAARGFRSSAASIDAFADVVEDTKKRMIVIAAMSERDAAQTHLASVAGMAEPAATVPSSGKYAMTAAADDYDDKSHHAGQDQNGQPQAGGGMMPMGGIPAMLGGAAGVAVAARAAAGGGVDHEISSDVAEFLRHRARELQSALPADVAGRVRMAVGLGQDGSGGYAVVVGTSEHNGYLRPGVTTEPDESVVGLAGDPEGAVVEKLRGHGLEVTAVASGIGEPVVAGDSLGFDDDDAGDPDQG